MIYLMTTRRHATHFCLRAMPRHDGVAGVTRHAIRIMSAAADAYAVKMRIIAFAIRRLR